jgi:hypothetical protein
VASRTDLRSGALRLVAARVRAESKAKGCSGLDHHRLHVPMPFEQEHEEGYPEVTFYAVRENSVEEIEIFLTEDLLERLHEADPAVWQGVLEFIEDDLLNRS